MGWLLVAVVAIVAVASGGLALETDPGSDPAPEDRYTVDTDALTDAELREGLEAAGGHLVRTDAHLGFAVLALEDPEAFETEAGQAPSPDPGGQPAARTPAAEVPLDAYLGAQWGPLELNAPQAWAIAGPDVSPTIAVVDSGIAIQHPDLPADRVTMGHDYIDGDEDPVDTTGHGSHVTGIASAIRDNDRGVAGMTMADLFVTRVFGPDGGFCSDMASAIVDSVDAGADVINLSGHCFDHNDPLHEAVQHAWEAGVLVVVAAGNAQQSDPSECVRHPAIHAQALAVAATDPALQAADYSCRGPQVELAAPGSLVLSTLPGGYGVYSGTSMAAPHVTATGAMLLDQNPSMTPADVRDRLNETARDLGEDGHDETYGHGMVDPVAALSGRPAYVPTSTEALDSETSDPFDLACAHLGGDAECTHVAVGGTGDATTAGFGLASASATGDATACESRVGNGAVAIHPTCLALTATGDARADRVAASGASG